MDENTFTQEIPAIAFEHVNKSWEETPVLSDILLKVNKGEFVTIIGQSGCGKTTLLKMMNALVLADSGKVLVNGEDVAKADKVMLRRGIGYCIQDVGLFPTMTVRRNIEYIPRLFGKAPESAVAPEELMDMVQLDRALLSRYPRELSGGQKQRVGIARALAIMPPILLMDEPFGAVDEISRKHLQTSISQIHQQLGLTVLFVTHSVEEAVALGTKMAVMGKRSILQYDEPKAVIADPADALVRELVCP